MPALDLAREAKDIIADPLHWTTRAYARDISGLTVNVSDEEAYRYCSTGVLYRVRYIHDFRYADYREIDEALGRVARKYGFGCIETANDTLAHRILLAIWGEAIEILQGHDL